MRICHGLLGEVVEIEDRELQWQKPIDIIRHHVRDRWQVDVDDLIILVGSGGVLGPTSGTEELGSARDVFIFLRSALDPQASSGDDATKAALYGAFAAEGVEDEAEGEEEATVALADALRMVAPLADDPVFETFRCNIAEARRRLAEVRPAMTLATRLEARLEVQRLAVQAVLDNLTSHRATCSRSLSLFLQKYERVQERLDQNLSKVEASMEALHAVPLHPAVKSAGRECLADAVPRDRILRFTTNLQAERGRLAQQLDRLRQQDSLVQNFCDQAATKVHQLLQDTAVDSCTEVIRQHHVRAMNELLPALNVRVPLGGTESALVLEEERRCAGVMEGLAQLCREMLGQLDDLRDCWQRRIASFLQRLREVSYTQSKVRGVERQAALLEEEINVQHKSSQQLDHLQKMPKAYQKALSEVGRRRAFRARYTAQSDQARSKLARMMEDENNERRGFVHRYGCHLPTDLVRGLGALVPPVSVEVPEFDAQLPDLGPPASSSQEEANASCSAADAVRQRRRTSSSSTSTPVAGAVTGAAAALGGAIAAAAAAASAALAAAAGACTDDAVVSLPGAAGAAALAASSTSSCSSSLRADPGASSMRSAAGGVGTQSGGTASGSGGRSCSSGGSQAQAAGSSLSAAPEASSSQMPFSSEAAEAEVGDAAQAQRRVLELEAQKLALEQRVEALLSELAAQQQQQFLKDKEPQPEQVEAAALSAAAVGDVADTKGAESGS